MLFFGVFGLIVGIALTLTSRKGLRRYHRIKNTPTTSVASAPGTGAVELKGRVVAGELDQHESPLTGARGVWVKFDIQEMRQQGKNRNWVSVLAESHHNPFWLDDRSGQQARIEPDGGELVVDMAEVASAGTFRDASPHLQQFLQSRGLSPTDGLGMNKALRFLEFVLVDGAALYALGCSRRIPGPPVHDGYRMAPSTQLVVFHGASEGDELLISAKAEDDLARGLRLPFLVGIVILIASVVSIVAGVLID